MARPGAIAHSSAHLCPRYGLQVRPAIFFLPPALRARGPRIGSFATLRYFIYFYVVTCFPGVRLLYIFPFVSSRVFFSACLLSDVAASQVPSVAAAAAISLRPLVSCGHF